MKTPTPEQLLTPALLEITTRLHGAREAAKKERARVDAYARALLAEKVYMVRKEFREGRRAGDARITEPNRAYLMDDREFLEFDAKMQAFHRADGYTQPDGHCPALIAERICTETEWALIEEAGRHFGITNDDLLCSGLETRAKFINLVVGMADNHLMRIGAWNKAARMIEDGSFLQA